MYQLIIVLLAFLFIPIFIKRDFKLSTTLFIIVFIMSILAGLGIKPIGQSLLQLVKEPGSRDTIITILMINVLGGLMKDYGILDRVIENMLEIVNNKRLILIIFPALIGVLVIPGGAILSAPFINNLGGELEVPKERRAAINLVFRHIATPMLPYSSTLLFLIAALPGLNIYKLIAFNSILAIGQTVIGYFLFIRDIKPQLKEKSQNTWKAILALLLLTSPIYSPVIINMLTGLPFFISMLASFLIVYLLSGGDSFIKRISKVINWNVILTVVAILLIKDIILRMDSMLFL